MNIPENILEKQLCTSCHKYLSWGPVKIYPNAEVVCGRCPADVVDDDLGVVSSIYSTIIENMTFPCVNRFDGCDAILPLSKMKRHELNCLGDSYDCFLCGNFRGSAYYLNLHCRKLHRKDILPTSDFWIDLTKSCLREEYFYSKGPHLFSVLLYWNSDVNRLTLDVSFIGKLYKGNMFYSLRLYSTEKDLLYQSKRVKCSVMKIRQETRIDVDMIAFKVPKQLVICNFSIHDEPDLAFVGNIPISDSTADSSIIRCVFKNVDKNFSEAVYFPGIYCLKDKEWKLSIKRKLSLTDYKRKFGVFLQMVNTDPNVTEVCKVSATFGLFTADLTKKISKSFRKREYKFKGQNHGLMLEDWNHVMDPSSGYLDYNNSLIVEVKVKIYLEEKDEPKCHNCYNSCIYC